MTKRDVGGGLHRNTISYIGLLVVVAGAFLMLFSMVVEWSLRSPSPYLGMFTYLIFPGILASGVMLVLIGMWRESRRRKGIGTEEALPYPRVDLNDPKQRRKFAFVTLGSFFIIIIAGFGGYNTFLFTESVTFCGRLCHTVMEPEYSAFQHSPHAKVSCVECHVGSGASFYVKAKLSGVRQVFAVLFHAYETPISTPVKNLRPARETCEECHWPNKFYGAQLLQIPYFRYDEANTSDQISLMMKTGGGSSRLGQSAGIHWHMIIDNTIIFATPDPKQQEIPWFKVKGAYGQEREYMSLDKPISLKQLTSLPKHIMDCMDCHNRPTHIFMPPDRAVDLALNNGSISRELPWIKKAIAEALMTSYKDNETARKQIRDKVFNFYAKDYIEIYNKKSTDIEEAVSIAIDIYNRTVFPAMKVDWRTYPDNIGHRNWPGCFRCHDGRHATSDGKILTNKCTTCHTMPQRGQLESIGALPPVSDESWHPFKLTGKHAKILCNRCHSPGVRPSSDCNSCHKHSKESPMGGLSCTDCHITPGEKEPVSDCKACHSDLGGLHKSGGHPETPCIECHKQHVWKVADKNICLSCHDDKKNHNINNFCGNCHEFK